MSMVYIDIDMIYIYMYIDDRAKRGTKSLTLSAVPAKLFKPQPQSQTTMKLSARHDTAGGKSTRVHTVGSHPHV